MIYRTPFVYLAERSDGYIKVGISQSPGDRMRSLSVHPRHVGAPRIDAEGTTRQRNQELRKVSLVATAPGDYREEKHVHERLRQYKVDGCSEWFHDSAEVRAVVGECFKAFRAKAEAAFSNALLARRAERLKFAKRASLRISSEKSFAEAKQ